MRTPFTLSRRTLTTSIAGFAAIALVSVVVFRMNDHAAATTLAMVCTVVLAAFAAGITLSAALRIPVGEAIRRRWAVLGLGISLYVFGQIIRLAEEHLLSGMATYPGIADVFLVGSGLAIAIGLVDAAASVRRFGVLDEPLLGALAVSMALIAIETDLLLIDVLGDEAIAPLAKAMTLYRPLSDVLLGVLPALYVVFAFSLGGGRLGRPWIPVAFGVMLLALTDATYSWLSYQGAYQPGQLTDVLWMVGYMLIAVGALVHMDVDHEEGLPAVAVQALVEDD